MCRELTTPIPFVSFRERSDRVVEWFDHDGKEAGLLSVTAWDAHRSVAVRHAPACPAFSVSP
ncbi:hypothetical protein JCM14469_26370 [Desulfatiferula olefinivorans]